MNYNLLKTINLRFSASPNYIKRLAQWRKNSPVLHDGKLMQFVPEKGIYVYFRNNKENNVMVVVNTNEDL